jgi:D-alanyl-lipoteichoic acid acyltransferase DltB (MBOAT superfamily)
LQFTTPTFAYVFLVILTISWALREHRTVQKSFLLLASLYCYAQLDMRLTGLLVGSSAINWGIGEVIALEGRPAVRKRWLTAALVLNLGYLGYFKYCNFFLDNLGALAGFLGLEAHLPALEVLLPLGISFYTFQALSYLIDIYRGTGIRAQTLLDFLLYVALFPKLMAGPICRSRELLPQIHDPAPAGIPEVSQATVLIASGLFKKVFIASLLSTGLVDDAFVAPDNYSSGALLVAAYAYSVQLYCDFSGYTDMARGLGLLLGFRLPENFAAPYSATNIGDFWRRWHITFSTWLREYIYFPLGGSRAAPWKTYRNLMITFLLCGLWHGAAWRFVIWGGIHGVALCVHKAWRDFKRDRGIQPNPSARWPAFAGWFATFHLCVLARIFFQASDMETAWLYWSRLLDFQWAGRGVEPVIVVVSLLGLALNFGGRGLRQAAIRLHERVPWPARPLLWAGTGAVLFAVKPAEVAPYLYFRF